jgi:hypothetical protein
MNTAARAADPEACRKRHRQPGHELRHDRAADLVERRTGERDPRRPAEGRGLLRDRQRPVLRDPGRELHVGRRVEHHDDFLGVIDRLVYSEREGHPGEGDERPPRRPGRAAGGRGAYAAHSGQRGHPPPSHGHDHGRKQQPQHYHRRGLEPAEEQQREAGQQERQHQQRGQHGQPGEEQAGVRGVVSCRADGRRLRSGRCLYRGRHRAICGQ